MIGYHFAWPRWLFVSGCARRVREKRLDQTSWSVTRVWRTWRWITTKYYSDHWWPRLSRRQVGGASCHSKPGSKFLTIHTVLLMLSLLIHCCHGCYRSQKRKWIACWESATQLTACWQSNGGENSDTDFQMCRVKWTWREPNIQTITSAFSCQTEVYTAFFFSVLYKFLLKQWHVNKCSYVG